MRRLRDARQNHTLTVKTKNRNNPSDVIDKLRGPKLEAKMECPLVKNKTGIEIIAAKKGMKTVRETKSRNGILDNKDKNKGIVQSKSKYDSEDMNREETIMNTMAINLANGFMDCKRPRLPLKSST
jgi:hypothetical protein